MKKPISKYLLVFASSILLMLAGLAHPTSANADGNWRNGWCEKGEGLTVVVSFGGQEYVGDWPDPRGYMVRCAIGPNLNQNLNSAERGLAAAGYSYNAEYGGSYIDEIEGFSGMGFLRGCGTVEKGWRVVTPMETCSGLDDFQYFASASQRVPAVLPQYLTSGGGSANHKPTASAPSDSSGRKKPGKPSQPQKPGQTYNPGSNTGTGGQSTNQAGGSTSNTTSNPGSSTALTQPPTGTENNPSQSPSPSEEASETTEETGLQSESATPSPTNKPIYKEEAAGQTNPADVTSAESNNTIWLWIGLIAGALVLAGGITGGILYVRSRH